MPEVLFTIELPGGVTHDCYSPSSVVRKYFATGDTMPAAEFLDMSRKALGEANERVRAKFGMGCGQAAAQLSAIEKWMAEQPPDAPVRIVTI